MRARQSHLHDARMAAITEKKLHFWPVRCRSLGMVIIGNGGRTTAQKCARSSTHECTRSSGETVDTSALVQWFQVELSK